MHFPSSFPTSHSNDGRHGLAGCIQCCIVASQSIRSKSGRRRRCAQSLPQDDGVRRSPAQGVASGRCAGPYSLETGVEMPEIIVLQARLSRICDILFLPRLFFVPIRIITWVYVTISNNRLYSVLASHGAVRSARSHLQAQWKSRAQY